MTCLHSTSTLRATVGILTINDIGDVARVAAVVSTFASLGSITVGVFFVWRHQRNIHMPSSVGTDRFHSRTIMKVYPDFIARIVYLSTQCPQQRIWTLGPRDSPQSTTRSPRLVYHRIHRRGPRILPTTSLAARGCVVLGCTCDLRGGVSRRDGWRVHLLYDMEMAKPGCLVAKRPLLACSR